MAAKQCSRCKVTYTEDQFGFHKQKQTLGSWCKSCNTATSKAYKRTPRGLAQNIYAKQISSSIRRKHPMPSYDREWFTNWLITQSNFQVLFDAWVTDNYSRDLIPSADRLNDNAPYTEKNIQLTSWKLNNIKGQNCYTATKNPKIGVQVNQLSLTGKFIKTFSSVSMAAKTVKCSMGEISRVCRGIRPTCRNFKWEYTK